MPDKTTTETWIDLLIRKAKALREAGVLDVEIDGCKATLAPVPPEMPAIPTEPSDGQHGYHSDAMQDPMLYPGGVVPTLMNHRDPDD